MEEESKTKTKAYIKGKAALNMILQFAKERNFEQLKETANNFFNHCMRQRFFDKNNKENNNKYTCKANIIII